MALFRRDVPAQLTQRADVTFALLADASWKKRGVEEITIGSALSVESRRSFQCADVGATLGPLRPRGAHETALLLPVTTLPKRPLLGFDVSAPDRTIAYLPPRAALADIEAGFVVALARSGGVSASPALCQLLVKVCEFTPGIWERWQPDEHNALHRLRSFLSTQTGWALTAEDVMAWLRLLEPAAAALADAIEMPLDPLSAAENPLLVLPLIESPRPLRPSDVTPLLREYVEFVARCQRLTDVEPFVPHALLSEYGRRWELMVECTVPLDGPFMVRISERRPIDLDWRGHASLDVTTGDALSNHVVIRVTDENVVIKEDDLAASTVRELPVHEDEFDGIRVTREEVALYVSGEREYRTRLRLKLRPVWEVHLTHTVVAILTAVSLALVSIRWGSLDAADLAVIVIPTTFAASLVVTRERTTLATRLLRPWRILVLAVSVILWMLVGAYFLSDTRTERDPCSAFSVTPPVLADPQHLPRQQARRCDGQEHR